jgi:hypothetical protein
MQGTKVTWRKSEVGGKRLWVGKDEITVTILQASYSDTRSRELKSPIQKSNR